MNRFNTPLIFPISAIAVLLPLQSAATTSLDTVNVTANRMARSADQTLAPVTVITREEIVRSQARSITQLLDGTPGVAMSNNGGLGKTTGIRLRGTGSSQVLVLIDGQRIGSATLGTVAFQDLPPDQIERIEIVRGSRSQLYGADAMGGVVQIFTRRGEGLPRLTASLEYGSHETVRGSAGVSGSEGSFDYSLHLSHLDTEGFNALKNNNPDKDGYRNDSLSGSVAYRFENDLRLSASFLRAEGKNEYDSAWGAADLYDTESLQQSLNTRLEYAPTDVWDLTLTLGESRDETVNLTNGLYASHFDTRRRQFGWQNDFALSDQAILTLGYDFLRDEVSGSSNYSQTQRDNNALYVQLQSEFGANSLGFGLRHDDNEAFGGHTTGNIAWGRELAERLRLVVSYGTGFRAPTFNDLYYQDPWGSNGNPNLMPEESESYELALTGTPEWGNWNLNLFRTEIDGLIDWVEISPWVYQPQNVNRARIDGLEAGLDTELAGWRLGVNVTLLDPRNSVTGKLLTERSERTLRLDLDRRFSMLEVGATLKARSHSYSDTANTLRTDGFGVLDLRAAYHLDRDWTLRGQIRNLLDRDYETVRTYNTGGREFFVSVNYQPK